MTIKKLSFFLLLLSSNFVFGQLMADKYTITPQEIDNDTLKTKQLLQHESADLLAEGATSGKKRRARKLYKQLGYQASADLYKKMEEKGDIDASVMGQMAKSYRLNGDTENAEYWYSKIVNQETEPATVFHYAQALQSNGKCEDAVRWYQVFNKQVNRKEQVNIDFIEDCSELNNFEERASVQLTNVSVLNSESIDYCAIPYKNGVVFTSTRGLNGISKNTDNWTKENFSDLFYAEKKADGSYSTPTSLASDVNGRYHDGVASFTNSQDVMYFSRNNRAGKSKDGMIDLKVYKATVNDSKVWSEAKELPFNSAEFATCHPTVTKDGKRLYFASDRPEGFGGMDIYVSELNGGTWSTPINLGPTVNTVGNEIFPNISTDGILYFASNGHRGMGGLDIFAVQQVSTADAASWMNRVNIGLPFNTSKDDFGFSTNMDATEGFITSNRDGGRGEDDIYEWASKESIDFFNLKKGNTQLFAVLDKASANPVGDAVVTFETFGEGIPIYYSSDPLGELAHELPVGQRLTITVEKDGFLPWTKTLNADDILANRDDVYEMNLDRRACTELNGRVINKDCNKSLAGVTVRVLNKCTGKTESFTSNREGLFDACLDCGCDYELTSSKANFGEQRTSVTTISKNCGVAKPIDVTLHVRSISPKSNVVVPTTNTTTTHTNTVEFLGIPSTNELRVGALIKLENVYYDYNKFTIRNDASTDLDELIQLMNQYPTMEIELGSHTDVRGKEMYNYTLSMNRATAAVKYLVERGVAPSRLVAKGFGESRPINHCENGVECTDEEHQQNRRTEIKIIKM